MRELVFTLIAFMLLSPVANAAVKWNNSSSSKASNSTGEINTYGGTGYINENEKPNFQTLRWSLYRKIHYRPLNANRFHSIEGTNSYEFETDLKQDSYVKRQMETTPLLSYLMYEGGKITIDEITPKGRFGDMFSDTTMYHSMSMGKSITSFLVGHAICIGKINGIDAKLDDWPVLKGTLYHNQKLLNFLNMATGDEKHSKNDERSLSIQNRMANEFQGTKKSSPNYNYTNMNTNLVLTYLLYKFGEQGFKEFLDDVFINKIRIQHEVRLNKTPGAKAHEKSLGHQFFATRYDYLRIAKSMLYEWQKNTCVGQYLKKIHQKRISKNRAQGKHWFSRVGLPRSYAGFFHTGYKGMESRPVMGMDGNGGQTILIDFERGRIIATLAVFDNMGFPKTAGYDFKKISYEKIKEGSLALSDSSNNSHLVSIPSEKLKIENRLRREEQRNAKIFWDKHYDEIFFGSKPIGTVLLSENFNNKTKLSVSDYDNNWRVEKENNGNFIYCNKVQNGWSDLNFGEDNWSNYSVSFKMKFASQNRGKTEAHIRKTKKNKHTAVIQQMGSQTSIELLGKYHLANVSATEWLDFEISIIGSAIKTFVNGEMATSSNNAFWEKGSAMISVPKNTKLCVDDIIVQRL
tara:strand:- start:77 stop:1969 length:1893 start_codon:yes stop_codon:yes gene_type:complete